jgi:AhpD family alkylhydroperoxidase
MKKSSTGPQIDRGSLSTKTKELIALGLSVATDCKCCIESHIEQAARAGASLKEVREAIEIAAERGGAAVMTTVSLALDVMEKAFEHRPTPVSVLAKTRWC